MSSDKKTRAISVWVSLWLLFSLNICGFSSWVRGDVVDAPQLAIESYRLPNGLQVALSSDPTAPRTTVCVTYHVGSKNERAGLTGFAHFFEHMMFRGTKNVPNFDTPLQQAGGSPNAFTSEDVTVYFETVPSSYLERTLFMEAERMAFLPTALDLNKFDTEREIVKNERRQRMENVPYGLARETIASHLFPMGHPYSWSVIGSMQDLNNASLVDLRRFFYEFYHPGNATLTVVGSFDLAAAKRWIENYFGALGRGPQIGRPEVQDVPVVTDRITQFDQVRFPRVYWSWPTVPETHEDAPALELLADLLTDGDASRLRRALVIDESWATDVSANSDAREIAGLFSIDAIVAPGKTPEEVERVLSEQLARIRSAAPSQEEVTRAIRKYQKKSLLGLTATTGRAFAIGMGLAQHDDPHYYQTVFRGRTNVTPQDIQRVVSRYLTAEKLVLYVLPTAEGEEESPAVLAGPLPLGGAPTNVAARDPQPGIQWAQLPGPGQGTEFSPPAFETHRLSNGLNVWIAPWRTLPLVSAQLVVPAGSANAPREKSGLAQLTARLWEKGTQDLTSTEFAEALDALGATLTVNASADTTELSFTVVKDALPETLTQVGSMVMRPRFAASDFDREQALQLSELARGPDNPGWIAQRVFPGLLYGPDHPYGLPVSGFVKTVEALSRQDVHEFYQHHFVPAGATLIIAGDVDTAELLAQIEATWGPWQGAAVPPKSAASEPVANHQRVYIVDKPGAVQSVLSVGRLWRDRQDPSYFATRIGNRVLGGDFLSRINQNLREQNGYTYGAQSGFRYRQEGSEWVVQTSVRANVTAAALREIMAEVAAAGDERPLTETEVSVARTAELNTFPAQFESPSQIAAALATLARHQLPKDYFHEFPPRLGSVDAAEVARIMGEVGAADQLITLVVGDRGQIVPQLEQAGFRRLTFLDSDGRPVEQVE